MEPMTPFKTMLPTSWRVPRRMASSSARPSSLPSTTATSLEADSGGKIRALMPANSPENPSWTAEKTELGRSA